MPLARASQRRGGRALLLCDRFRRGRTRFKRLETCRSQRHRGHGARRLIGVPIGTYFLSRLDPVTTRWIISCFVAALLLLLLSGWRYRGKDHAAISVGIGGLSGCSGLAQTGGRRSSATGSAGRSPPMSRAPISCCSSAPQFLFPCELFLSGLITADSIKSSFVVGRLRPGVWFGASLFGKASEQVFRTICYALIATAVIVGLPALDGVLRGR